MATWKRGDRGDAVTSIQQQLNRVGYMIAVDGAFGDETDWAVRQFQTARGLTVDGIVGPETIVNLNAAIAMGWTADEGAPAPTPTFQTPVPSSVEVVQQGPPTLPTPAGAKPPAMKEAGIFSSPVFWVTAAVAGVVAWFVWGRKGGAAPMIPALAPARRRSRSKKRRRSEEQMKKFEAAKRAAREARK